MLVKRDFSYWFANAYPVQSELFVREGENQHGKLL